MICSICAGPVKMGIAKEDHVYYIGDDKVHFRAYIEAGVCIECGAPHESPDSTAKRAKAMGFAIDDYWENKFKRMGVNPNYMDCWRSTAKRLFDNGDITRKRRAAEEFGLWLAGQHFT